MSSITDDWNRETARMGSPRLQRGPLTTALQLGPLASLVGSWRGPGFNAIWRPDNIQPPANSAIHRFLELNRTTDSSPPPFSTAGQALHIEPGLFMNVPGSQANNNQATIVRMGSIPHGTT